jgi:type I restriction enzyme S subunit
MMHWVDTTIGEYCPFAYGKGLPQVQRSKGLVPVYGANGCVDYHNESYVKGPGIIIGRKGSVGAVHLSAEPFWPIDTTFYIEQSSIDELRFTYHLLKSLALQQMHSGSAIPGLNRENVHARSIRIPARQADRQRIGAWIGAFDNKIALNRQTNQTLERIARALFISWFVDMEPVKAKVAVLRNGGNTAEAERAAMAVIAGNSRAISDLWSGQWRLIPVELVHTAALFPAAMEPGELGQSPTGWQIASLLELVVLTAGGTPKRSEPHYWDGTIPWFSMRDIPAEGDVFVVDTEEKITQLGLAKSSAKLLNKGSTIITARGTVGKLALLARDMCTNQSCYGVRGKKFGPYFNYCNLQQAVATLKRNSHGAVFDTITTKTFASYRMSFCGPVLADAFDQAVAPLMRKIESNVRQNIHLTALRDFLFTKLLLGEIHLPIDSSKVDSLMAKQPQLQTTQVS